MNLRRLFQASWITGVVFVGGTVLAPSATATTVAFSCVGIPLQNTELNASVMCPQFTGTGLLSIDIDFTGDLLGSIGLTNNGAAPQTVQGTTASKFTVGSLAGFTIPIPLFSVSYSTGIVSLAGGESQNFPGLTGSGGISVSNSTAGTFTPYMGVGDFSIPVFTLTSLLVEGGGGQIASAQSTQSSAAAMVTYTFQTDDNGDVPETQSYLLLGSGLTMLALLRRRSKAA